MDFREIRTPLPRKRALTLPLPEKPTWIKWRKQKTKEQTQCLLMKLPLELREEIYRQVLGNKVVRIWRTFDELGHTSCPTQVVKKRRGWLNGRLLPDGPRKKPRPINRANGNLALLLTCREIYSEAINTLYTQNTIQLLDFDKQAFEIPALLRRVLLPQRFFAIRSLEIPINLSHWRHYISYCPKGWIDCERWKGPLPESTWDVIATMKGLRRLRVRIRFYLREWYFAYGDYNAPPTEEILLGPLMELNWIPDFQVEVSWPADDNSERTLRNAPFRLTRVCEDDEA
ncbi:hypothetical protein N7474_010463 [Penicillium riverlandense]|uniref:uncharacterized protein n=1 Tax=Penicillium riverlandense TaxID=1903569 RepID=UPI0025494105|nr:uncharacterized protein N7474_010463 [Penicillium riverlandense]KAJ5806871.1 hypothetical protein N7474_010463 [Penicillium riverlandense]